MAAIDPETLLANNPYFKRVTGPARAVAPASIQDYWSRVNSNRGQTYQQLADILPTQVQNLVPPTWANRFQAWAQQPPSTGGGAGWTTPGAVDNKQAAPPPGTGGWYPSEPTTPMPPPNQPPPSIGGSLDDSNAWKPPLSAPPGAQPPSVAPRPAQPPRYGPTETTPRVTPTQTPDNYANKSAWNPPPPPRDRGQYGNTRL